MFLTGKRIGRYYLQSLIEQGGMGDIYLALDTHLQRRVAFKVIKTAPAAHANTVAINEAVDLFKREANAVTLLDHPYILPLYDYGEETCEGMLLTYIVMPYRPEGTLADWISKRSRAGPITVYEAAHFLRQAASALQFAHDHGIIHRDVKPSNFLIMSNKQRPDRPDVQLADFGVAKFMRAISTPTGIIRGTPLYMAPEFWRGATVPASDQYALALMIYEMITGSHPFQGDGPEQLFYQHMYVEPPPPSELNPAISAEIDAVLLRALSKNPAHRYDSVAAFAKAFRQALVQKNAVAPAPVNKTQKAVMLESADVIERTHPARPLKPLPPLGGKRPGRNKRKLFIFGLAILLIFSGVSIVVYSTLHQANGIKQVASSSSLQSETASGRIHASQTAGANQNLTATSIAKNATATTVAAVATSVSATQTAVSNTKTAVAGATAIAATATAQAYNNILKVGPNQQGDSLQSSNTGFNWDTINAPSGVSCAYSQGAYHAGDPKSNDFSVCFEHQYDQLTDFACQVSMTIVKGDRGGIAFRANPVSGTYYYFYIDAKGNYGLALVNSFTQEPPLDQGFSSAIHAGLNQTNLVAVVAKGNDIMVFVNMQLILHATDSSNTVGNIGVVGQDVNNATDVAFSDMQIWY